MAYYIMVGEGVYPIAQIAETHRDHLPIKCWTFGEKITVDIPQPIVYDLVAEDEDEYDQIPNIHYLADFLPIPFMHSSVYEALLAAGVVNLQIYDALICDSSNGVEHKDFKAYNLVGVVAAADMNASTMMEASDSA